MKKDVSSGREDALLNVCICVSVCVLMMIISLELRFWLREPARYL